MIKVIVVVALMLAAPLAQARVCSVVGTDPVGVKTTYYRIVGVPTKTLSGTITLIRPCNVEVLAVNPKPIAPPCAAQPRCSQTKWGGTERISQPDSCLTTYSSTVIGANGQPECAF